MINVINIACLLIFASTAPILPSKDDKLIIVIQVPMDDKTDTQPNHVVYKYYIYDSGFTMNFREISENGIQSISRLQLTKQELVNVKEILKNLPDVKKEIPIDRSLIITEIQPTEKKVKIFERTKLPAPMKELFNLLGGIRGGIKDKLNFESE